MGTAVILISLVGFAGVASAREWPMFEGSRDLFALGLPMEVGGFPLRGVLYLLLALLLVVALWALYKLPPAKPRRKRKRA